MPRTREREVTSVRAVRRSPVTRLVARVVIAALCLTMVPAELFARPARPVERWEQDRRAEAARRLAEDPSARPQPQASQPESPARLAPPAGRRSSHAWLVGRLALASLHSLLLRLVAPAPQAGGGSSPAQTTRAHAYPAGWSLVAVPLHPADSRATAVFDELPSPLRLYDTANGQTVSPEEPGFRSVAPGRAFWALLDGPATVSATGTLVSTTTPQAVPLQAGWNAVSTPWLTPVDWTDAGVSVRRGTQTVPLGDAVTLGWLDPDLDVHDPATDTFTAFPPNATPAGQLRPWQGALVFAHVPADLVFSVPPPDTVPPVVSFATPAEGAEIGTPTAIQGTADDANLLEWSLAVAYGSLSPFTPLASGDSPVNGGAFTTLDPTVLENGPVRLLLTATDAAGNQASVERTLILTGDAKIGLFRLVFKDLDVPVAGVPIVVSRIYDSRARGSRRDFGFGWSLQVEGEGRYTNNRKPGDGWTFTTGPLGLPCAGSVVPTKTHYTEVRFSDREAYRFSLRIDRGAAILGGCLGTARFAQIGGPPGAILEILGGVEVFWQAGGNTVVEFDTFDVYEPTDVRLTTATGRTYDLALGEGLRRVADLSGNAVAIGPGGITHTSGKGIQIVRDGQGRVVQVTDPAGEATTYEYDAVGDLVRSTDREENATTFTYSGAHAHLLEAVVDPRGVQAIRNEFDEDGRLLSHTDAAGETIEFAHDVEGRQETVTDRLGHTRVIEYDDGGNVTRERDPLGNVTTRTFDTRGNRLTETNALGQTVTTAYDSNDNVSSASDALGNVTTLTYNARNQALTTTDPRGKVTTNAYSAAGNLLTVQDPSGAVTTNTYDARGNLLTQKDVAGNLVTYAYDAFGHLTRETDPLGHVITYTYDAAGNRLTQTRTRTTAGGQETLLTTYTYDRMGRLTQVTDPDGTATRTVYDPLGRKLETEDKLGRKTTYAYDDLGQLVKTTHPDATTEELTYDAEGRQTTSKDRAGRVTTFEYDALGRVTRTIFPDGSSTASTYDAAGSLLTVRDARGNVTTYEYDAAGRRTKETNALGQASTFTYDANGNLVSVTDPASRTTTYEYDDLNRRRKTTYHDGTFTITTYAGNRRVAEADQADKTTQYAYDAAGRLLSVTDAEGQLTRYAYDEVGNRISLTDANGHVTRFEHDALGRLTRQVLADGKSEVRTYDAAGNLATRTDFAGRLVTHGHDVNDRLVSRAYPDGSSVAFTYTPTGQRASVTDAHGATTNTYDLRDRLQATLFPDGRRLGYAYDAHGNRTSVTATLGGSTLATSFAYDELNRLRQVTDPNARVYQLGYDPAGNRASLAHPNGVTTAYTYSPLNRLTELVTQRAGTVVQSYAFTLGAAGNRTQVQEADGTVRQYTYDDVYRLTGETVVGAVTYTKAFTYDGAGNRLTQVTTGTGGPGTPTEPGAVSYGYDTRHRLLSAGASTFLHDDNGNLVSGAGAYTWDFDDRLVQAVTASGAVVEHAYDADGNRVRTRITPATGPPATTHYLVDASGSLGHVVAETDEAGALQAYYVRAGDELLSVIRPGGTRFYHADGLGSVRRLSDETGTVTDAYTYTAFGERIEHVGTDPQPYAFAGEPLDPNSGFQYHRARWLDPRQGRFTGTDPFEGQPFDPRTLHKYTYAASDAVNKTDPTGRFFLVSVSVANSIRSTLAGMQANFGFALIAQISEGGSAGLRELVLGAVGGLILTGAVIFAARLFARLARFGRAAASVAKNAKAGEAFDDLAELRRGLGLPAAGSADDGATLARLELGGDKFYGINAHGQPVTLKVNAISKTHAETDAFQSALNAGGGGGKARLVVDRDLCQACGQNGAVKSMARQMGITELEVVTPSGTQIIIP